MTTVLIADDLDVSRRRLSIILSRQGYRVLEAGDGDEALRLMRSERPDVAVIDLLMPETDGFEFVRAVRIDPLIAETPVVFFSSNFRTEDAMPLALSFGVRHVLPKSCSLDQILGAIRESMTSPISPPASVGNAQFDREHSRVISSQLTRQTNSFVTALGDCLSATSTTPRRVVAASPPDRVRSSVAGAREDNPPLDLRILLAEDSDVNRRVVTRLAERLGCRVDVVEHGREVLEALDYDLHDLVLMDVQMPVMDGFMATAAIRGQEMESGKRIPIIAMTAHTKQGDREKCLAAGMDAYLAKPVRPGPLREAMLAWAVKERPAGGARMSRPPGERSWSADALRESCGDDPELVSEVVGMMLKGTPGRFERMEAAIAGKDVRRVSWEAHALKGVFLAVGAEALALACQDLLTLGERGDFAPIETIYPAVRSRWNRLKEEAASYLETLPVGNTGDL